MFTTIFNTQSVEGTLTEHTFSGGTLSLYLVTDTALY